MPDAEASKDDWRRWARERRAVLDFGALSEAVVRRLSAFRPLAAARRALVFLPLPDEIDLRPLGERLPAVQLAVTRTPDGGGVLTVHELGGEMETHRLGFEQPKADAPRLDPADLDILLLPGLAFDLWGTRLGRGAGYFDRFLMEIDATVPVVGVTPTELVVDRLPQEPHDLPVRYLATEEGVVEVAGAAPGPVR
jgi:5-formyltetrahydrofolate cyclo-ligase